MSGLRHGWRYGRSRLAGIVEEAHWQAGPTPALAWHFHAEAQAMVVRAGQRRVETPRGLVTVRAGQCLILPPHMPHRSPAETAGVDCLNLYLACAPGFRGCRPRLADLPGDILAAAGGEALLAWLSAELDDMAASARGDAAAIPLPKNAAGLARESYIRAFRRSVGVTPHAYGLAARLNWARGLLRQQMPPAEVAAEAGFADQSHLGRLFRRAFGTTPAAYRSGFGA